MTLLLLGFIQAGCGSASYRMVKPNEATKATPLDFKVEADGIELAVTGLIVYNGAGSWIKDAYWDEYVVRLTNRADQPVRVEELALSDVLDRHVAPGTDSWALEKLGRQHEAYLKSLGAPADVPGIAQQRVQRRPGAGDVAKGIAGIGVLGMLYVPGVAPAVAGPAFLYGAPVVLVAACPFAVYYELVVDPKARALAQREFDRRRLKLPVVVEPGAMIAGSVFFPVTPGPERLQLRGHSGEHNIAVTLALPGLAELHFTYVPDRAAMLAAKPRRFFEVLRPVPAAKSPPGPVISGQ